MEWKMMMTLCTYIVLVLYLNRVSGDQWPYEGDEYTMANINITYYEEISSSYVSESGEMGKFGTGRIGSASGILVHVRSGNSSSHYGCEVHYDNEVPSLPWIALVRRGRCNFDEKLEAAYLNNASALLVYNNKDDGLQKMTIRNKYRDKMIAVFLARLKGEELAALIDNGTQIMMQITAGTHQINRFTNINRTSVMFVSISFIVLMMISLAWLVFYYIQRFRYLHAKDRLSRQLTNAAQKALSKIPTRTIKNADKEVNEAECCAVCIEPYKASDVVRLLPCRHEFHKVCVDPWLLEHRTCPMCKMDILKHYGYVFTGSQESIVNMDMEAPIIGSRSNRRLNNTSSSTPSSPEVVTSSDQRIRVSTVSVHRGSSTSPTTRRQWSWTRSFLPAAALPTAADNAPVTENTAAQPQIETPPTSNTTGTADIEVVIQQDTPGLSANETPSASM